MAAIRIAWATKLASLGLFNKPRLPLLGHYDTMISHAVLFDLIMVTSAALPVVIMAPSPPWPPAHHGPTMATSPGPGVVRIMAHHGPTMALALVW